VTALPPDPPSPLGWLDTADVRAHMKLPVGTPPDELDRYVAAAEAFVARWLTVPDDPKVTAPDLYQGAILVAADFWSDRQTVGGVQSGGPDLGYYRLGDFSVHVQRLFQAYRRMEMIG
jgi:hypothetical protein